MKLPSTVLGCLVFFAVASFAQNRPKNSDIENIGTRDITAGTLNEVSLDKEVALGRELAAEYERSLLISAPSRQQTTKPNSPLFYRIKLRILLRAMRPSS